jgi:AraC-like DNA-binding protein
MNPTFPPADGTHLNLLAIHWLTPVSWNHDDLRAPYWRLYWNAEPGMFVTCGSQEIPLVPEQFVLIPPETSFASRADREVMHFYVHFLTSPTWRKTAIETLPTTAAQRGILSELIRSAPGAVPRWKIAAMVADGLSELPFRHWAVETAFGERVDAAVKLVESRVPQAVPVTDLAQCAGMNVNAFIRLFREQTGRTPAAFILERRLTAACLLLHHSEQSIERIAESCGFCDRHHFSRVFSQRRGISPAAFRRQARFDFYHSGV